MKPFALLTCAVAATLGIALTTQVRAADHGDAPTLSGDQACDIADVYAFLDPTTNNDNVILILTVRGFIVPGENNNFGIFDEDVRYTLNIDNTGDAVADMNIDVTFNQRQNPPILGKNGQVPDLPGFKGTPRTKQDAFIAFRGKLPSDLAGGKGKSTAPVTQPTVAASPESRIVTSLKNANGDSLGIDFFAGQADDPFFFDIPGFVRFVGSVLGGAVDPTHLDRGRDSFAGYNVMSIAMRVPVSKLRSTKAGAPTTIGVYATASRKTEHAVKGDKIGVGGYYQVDRLGVPGVNVAFLPYNSKNAYNGATPLDDGKGKFFNEIAGTLTALGTSSTNIGVLASVVGLPGGPAPLPRGAAIGTGDMLRLETDKAARPNDGLGGAGSNANGFPNGRRLGDDVIDTVLFLVTNGAITAGDHVNASDVPLQMAFPFLGLPQQPRDPAAGAEDNTRN